jgi:hypothetical protein
MLHSWEISAYTVLAGKPEGKRPLGISRSRWEDNIRIGLRGMGWCGTNWFRIGASDVLL